MDIINIMSVQMEKEKKEITEFLLSEKGGKFIEHSTSNLEGLKLIQHHVSNEGFERVMDTLNSQMISHSYEKRVEEALKMFSEGDIKILHNEILSYLKVESFDEYTEISNTRIFNTEGNAYYLTFPDSRGVSKNQDNIIIKLDYYENGERNGGESISLRTLNQRFFNGEIDKIGEINSLKDLEKKMSFEQKRIFHKSQKILEEEMGQKPTGYETLHYFSGVYRLIKSGESEKKAFEIVGDLKREFGIETFALFDAGTLKNQHNNVNWIGEGKDRKAEYKMGENPILYFPAVYDSKGSFYTSTQTGGRETRLEYEIQGLSRKGQVWIFQGKTDQKLKEQFEKLFEQNNRPDTGSIINSGDAIEVKKIDKLVISAHGSNEGITLNSYIRLNDEGKQLYYERGDGEREWLIKEDREGARLDKYSDFEYMEGKVGKIILSSCETGKKDETFDEQVRLAMTFAGILAEETRATVIASPYKTFGYDASTGMFNITRIQVTKKEGENEVKYQINQEATTINFDEETRVLSSDQNYK